MASLKGSCHGHLVASFRFLIWKLSPLWSGEEGLGSGRGQSSGHAGAKETVQKGSVPVTGVGAGSATPALRRAVGRAPCMGQTGWRSPPVPSLCPHIGGINLAPPRPPAGGAPAAATCSRSVRSYPPLQGSPWLWAGRAASSPRTSQEMLGAPTPLLRGVRRHGATATFAPPGARVLVLAVTV